MEMKKETLQENPVSPTHRHNDGKNFSGSPILYADVLEKLGFPVLLNFSSIYGDEKGNFAGKPSFSNTSA